MPIPKPNANEQKKDFISRCMDDGVMVNEYDESQRYAVCNTSWSEKMEQKSDMKIKTVNMAGAEIMKPGTWEASTGTITIKDSDIDEMIANFESGIIEPFLNLDHNDNYTDKVKDTLKVVALGWVDKLYKKGKNLYADFKQVPEKIADMIQSGQLKQKSPEFYKILKRGGKVYNNVLRAVSFFGADVPAIQGLSDAIEVLKENDEVETIQLQKFTGGLVMDNITISKSEYDELVSFKAGNESQAEKVEVLKAEKKDLASEVAKLKSDINEKDSEIEKLQNKMKEVEEKEFEMLKKEASSYIDSAIESGKLLPKFKDSYVKDYIKKSEDEKELAMFKEDIDSRGKIINLQDVKKPNLEDEIDEKADSADDIDKNIQAHMKANQVDYRTASIALGYMTEQEV